MSYLIHLSPLYNQKNNSLHLYIFIFSPPLLQILQKIKQKKNAKKTTTPPPTIKKPVEAIVHSVQQPLNLILYRSKFKSIQC